MMNAIGLKFACAAALLMIGVECRANSMMVVDAGARVIFESDRTLQMWSRGKTAPDWQVPLSGFNTGASSTTSAIARIGDNYVVVQRDGGNIHFVDAAGKLMMETRPVYEHFQLDIPFEDLKKYPSLFKAPIAAVGRTAAGAVSADGKYIYLVPDARSAIVQVPYRSFKPNVTILTNGLAVSFSDRNFTMWMKIAGWEKFDYPEWAVAENQEPTAMANCGNLLVVGTKQGSLEFFDIKDAEKHRLRQVSDRDANFAQILDVGCAGTNRAFSITFDNGAIGQIQLWDTTTKAMLDSAGIARDGHLGMAYAGSASPNGRFLATIGDGDVRIWSIGDGKLTLARKHYMASKRQDQNFAIAFVNEEALLYSDGYRVWELSIAEKEPRLFAGPPIGKVQ